MNERLARVSSSARLHALSAQPLAAFSRFASRSRRQRLADRALGQLLAKFNEFGPFVACEMAGAMLADARCAKARILLDDEQRHGLSGARIAAADVSAEIKDPKGKIQK